MSAFDAVDLGLLPPPDVVETLDYEAILDALKADFVERWPAFDAWVESDPVLKLLEVAAWRELLLRARVNDAARAVMLATATGADLDNLVALLDVRRRVLDPGDPDAAPPVPPTLETDAELRRRAQFALEATTAAGTAGRYTFYALGADPRVRDAAATSPEGGAVLISVVARDNGGVPDAALLAAVEAAVTAPAVRQLCDTVTVAPATLIDVAVTAALDVVDGPGAGVALATAEARVRALFDGAPIGRPIALSALYAALHVEGVRAVALSAPAADVAVGPSAAARLTALTLTAAP